MPSGLIDIVTYGSQDLFLTGTPEITFFKVVYRRYTNFAIESNEVPFDNETKLGNGSTIVLKRIGDLIHKMYLKVTIPQVSFIRYNLNQPLVIDNTGVQLANIEYKKCIIFMNANTNAYRAANDIFNASNISFSVDMVNTILQVFASYLTPVTNNNNRTDINNSVEWFIINSPINYLSPNQFNLYNIASLYNSYLGTGNVLYDPLVVSKTDFMNVLNKAINDSKIVQQYYDDLVYSENQKYNESININYKFAWVEKLGHSLIDYIDVSIGGELIDRQYGVWIDIWYELCGVKNQSDNYMKMIGNVPSLVSFDRNIKPKL